MHRVKDKKETVFVIDLSRSTCHVCGCPLQRDIKNAKEKCINPECQVSNVIFNTPFIPKSTKSQAAIRKATGEID